MDLIKESLMAKESVYGINLAGIHMNCRLRYPELISFFSNYLSTPDLTEKIIEAGPYEEQICLQQFGLEELGVHTEEKVLAALISDELLFYDRLIFHSAAFILQEKAWLLAAPSGTGKTTQYKNLKTLYPDKVDILCGDNPVLIFEPDRRVIVHHSPWNGKEGYGSERTAELAGIILLEQADTNEMKRLKPVDAVLPVFFQFNTFLKTEQQVHQLFELERRLLAAVPVFLFRNTGNLQSSEMLYREIIC